MSRRREWMLNRMLAADEVGEFSRFMGRYVTPPEIFSIKRELSALLHRVDIFNRQMGRD